MAEREEKNSFCFGCACIRIPICEASNNFETRFFLVAHELLKIMCKSIEIGEILHSSYEFRLRCFDSVW